MWEYRYVHPSTLDEALEFLHAHADCCKVCAGGTDLMVAARANDARLSGMEYLVDISGLPGLSGPMRTGDTVMVGALTTHDAASRDLLLPAMLRQACQSVGAKQTRNVATIGGNVINAAVAADTLSPLAALSAFVTLRSVSGERQLPLSELITGPGKTCIRPDELLTWIGFPALDGYTSAFIKLGRRKALAISRMNTAAALCMEDGMIVSARVSAGCVFAQPRRSHEAEAMLIGQKPSEQLFMNCGTAVADEMLALTGVRWSTAYKQPALAAVVCSALMRAAESEVDVCVN